MGNKSLDSPTQKEQDGSGKALLVMIDLSADKLRVFGDESFDERAQRVAAVAGLIGTEKEWSSLVDKWVARTGGKEFHANECETKFAMDPDREKHGANLALYSDLAQLVADSGLRGFGIACDLVSARRAFPHWDAEVGYYKCFVDFLNACGEMALAESRQIEEFTLHNRKGKEHNIGLIYTYFMERPEWKKVDLFCTKKLSFDTLENPRIQITDLMARETMKLLDNITGPVRRVMRKSLKTLATANGRIQFTAYEGPFFQDMKDKMAELEKVSELGHKDLIAWLQANKLQDNWSNRMHFLIWLHGQGLMKKVEEQL